MESHKSWVPFMSSFPHPAVQPWLAMDLGGKIWKRTKIKQKVLLILQGHGPTALCKTYTLVVQEEKEGRDSRAGSFKP